MASVIDPGSFAGISTYVSSTGYRAWGALKNRTFGNGNVQSVTFNNALLPVTFTLSKSGTSKIQKEYQYYEDGNLRYTADVINDVFDRLQTFDHQTRLTQARSGLEANGGEVTDPKDQETQLPYRQSYAYNAFSNMTERDNLNWGTDEWYGTSFDQAFTYVDNRVTGRDYDADGREISMAEDGQMADSTYDAAGRLIRQYSGDPNHSPGYTDDIYNYYDGDGRALKRLQKDYVPLDPGPGYHWVDRPLQYSIRSTVLGGEVVSEVNNTGKKLRTFVRDDAGIIAWQTLYHPTSGSPTESLRFEHSDASGMTRKMTIENGNAAPETGTESDAAEFDPMGQNAGTSNPYPDLSPPFPGEGCIGCGNNGLAFVDDTSSYYVNGRKFQCTVNGLNTDCLAAARLEALSGEFHQKGGDNIGHFGGVRLPNLSVENGPDFYNGYALLSVQNRQLGDTKNYPGPRKILADFLAKNKNCLEVINAKGKEKNLEDYESVIAKTPIHVNTYDEAGRAIVTDPSFGIAHGKRNTDTGNLIYSTFLSYIISDPPRIRFGVTTYMGPKGPIIWITHRGISPMPEDKGITPGGVLFHETLHRYLRDVDLNEHQDILNTLSIDLLDSKKGESEEDQYTRSIQTWIENGCSNSNEKSKKRK